jgi:DNA-binding response OmpR family regulator
MKLAPEIRVLIVEDDPFFQRVLHKRLTAESYQVQVANDGREGMKAIVAWEPDLVISDWMMPQVDGLELCQSVKTGLRESAPYFILLTAKGELSDRLLGLETGADDYLVKPCDQAELLARVRAGLRIVLLTRDLRDTVTQLRETQNELGHARRQGGPLHDLAALCPFCRRAQTTDQRWRELESYLTEQGVGPLSAETCPDCRAAGEDSHRRVAGE